ncbi:MAG: hypothetical protein ABFS45_03060 [Pseudomonadota bacterium]
MILLGQGWTVSQVGEALLLNEGTIRNYIEPLSKGGIEGLIQDDYKGSEGYLSQAQLDVVDDNS